MPAFSTEPTAPRTLTDADRVRDRMNRYAPPASKPIYLTAKPFEPARDRTRDRDGKSPRRHGTGNPGGLRLGWRGGLLVEALAVAVTGVVVLAGPPAFACRQQDAKTGFYAGDSMSKCMRRGVAARIDLADQRIKMLVRSSGQ